MADIKKIKLGEATYDLRDAGAARLTDAKITSDSTTTVAVGGIAKGSSLKDKSVAEIIESIFFPYVPFTFNSIRTAEAAGTFEVGTVKTISQVVPVFDSGSKAITSVRVGTTEGGAELYSGTTATSNTAIQLATNKTFDGKTGGEIYCTISDGETTATKSVSVNYTYYAYSKLTPGINPDTSGATKQAKSDADNTYSYTAGQYLWLYSRSPNKKIQTNVAGSWADVNTTASAAITLTLASGDSATYYAYRTDKFTATGSARYRLA